MNSKLCNLTVALAVALLTTIGISAQTVTKADSALSLQRLESGQTTQSHQTQQQGPTPAQPGSFEARVESLMRDGGFNFQKVKANSWYLNLPGKEMSQIRIILGAGPSSIAMGAVVVTKANLRLNPDNLLKLMKLSYDLNYVGVCIDNDDDLIVMAQRKDAWLSVDEFKNTISQVSEAADRAYVIMRPSLAAR